jgi:hypothetical protein
MTAKETGMMFTEDGISCKNYSNLAMLSKQCTVITTPRDLNGG